MLILTAATLGSPRVIPRATAAGSSDRVRLKNSEPSLIQSGLIKINADCSVSPGLNVSTIASLQKLNSSLADTGTSSEGVILTA